MDYTLRTIGAWGASHVVLKMPSHVVTLRGRRGKSEKEEYLTAKVMSTLRLILTGF